MASRDYSDTYLQGLRVLEVADELGEYAGKVLAGLGADVVKIEPPGGEVTRSYGPHYRDEVHPERSLYFWHYNQGKRSVVLDLATEPGRERFRALAAHADVIIDARQDSHLRALGLGYDELKAANPGLVYARVTPFGEDGPWADFRGSDLVHLALGGIAMNCGYDPDPGGHYEIPPIAPQMWQAYHITGEYTVISILAAILWRNCSGEGQYLSASVHDATSTCTEMDIPHWNVLRQRHYRQTGRHSMPELTPRGLVPTKDGRYLLPYTTYVKTFADGWSALLAMLRRFGMEADLGGPEWQDAEHRAAHQDHISDVLARFIGRLTWDREIWREMLAAGQPWAPIRRPEENLSDEHWAKRGSFAETTYPELGKTFVNVGARWVDSDVRWVTEHRAPLIGEHTTVVLNEWTGEASPRIQVRERTPVLSKHGKPFALGGLRVVDLSWMLASAGAGRILAALGAEVIKVEHESRPDGMRHTRVKYPAGGRKERDAATGPITPPKEWSINSGGNFMEINTGKLGLSLNLKSPEGREILTDLIRNADVVTEGFSPGTMDRMGFGFDKLKEINPRVIYVQQSGFGEAGTYGAAKAFGPTAQAFSGLTEMSGLPEPWPPAGIGFSYLDWFGAYNMATAVLAALARRDITGQGCHIDASQVEVGLYLTGTAILDYSANGRGWSRYGNRSPYKAAAPHGIYRTQGTDRWIAIACFTEAQWHALHDVLELPSLAADPRFSHLSARVKFQDDLDRLIEEKTVAWDRYELMYALQGAGVPAGVAQDAEDRIDFDPQLRAHGWQIELPQTENGIWPAREHPVRLSATPTYAGGLKGRHGPNYGEDTDDVLTRILGLSQSQVDDLRRRGVV